MDEFIPTYLYIKQHSVTGLLYFGKTQREPIKYTGSGTYWMRHINFHNRKFTDTLWYCLFLDKETIVEFARNFSIQENIVESDLWANLTIENGLDGMIPGRVLSEEHKQKISPIGRKHSEKTKQMMSESRSGILHPFFGKSFTEDHKQNLSIASKGKPKSKEHRENMSKPKSEEHKQKISEANSNISHPLLTCPYCNLIGGSRNMKRYHFTNCKFNILDINYAE